MAEGRMLKRRITLSKKMAALKTDKARLLWFYMLPFTDVEGRINADPEDIRDEILRKQRKGYTLGRIQECLLDLDGVGLIILYGDERGQYLQLTRHGEEQKINRNREAKSKIPAPLTEDSGVIQSNRVKLSKVKLSKDKDNTPLISPPKKRFLDNVLLTTEEHTKLVERFSAKTTAQWIEKLDSYIGSNGRKYKSHYKTIINWSLRDDRATTNTKSKAQRTESRRDFSGQESSFGKTLEV